MKFLRSLLVSACLALSVSALAADPQSQVGLQLGNVALTGDVTNSGLSNAIGYGAFYDFAASDVFELDMGLLYSQHTGTSGALNTKLTQTDLNIDAKWILVNYDVINPYGLAGVDILSRNLDLGAGGSGSASGFGLNVGLGVDLLLSEQLMAGLLFKYVYAFEQSTTIGGASVKIMQPYNTILARVGFRF